MEIRVLVPEQYRATDGEIYSIVHDNPFALLVTNGALTPFATHLPALIEPEPANLAAAERSLVGTTVLGHLNRSNPHWERLRAGGSSTLIFQGPNAYVSPTIYQKTPAAPTWNFMVVHLRGEVTPLTTTDEALEVVRRTVRHLEHVHSGSWDMTGSQDYFGQLIPGVGAWRMHVTSVEGMVKLSQEQPSEVRQRVVTAFSSSPAEPHRVLAPLIASHGGRADSGSGRCPA
jgi:transcriptional regulator